MKWGIMLLFIIVTVLPLFADQVIIGTKDAEDDDPFVMLSG
ncbi:MAG: hypothetical protein ACUVWP_00035 [bacterium]